MKFTGVKNGSLSTYGVYAEKNGQKLYLLTENGVTLMPGTYKLYIYVKPGIEVSNVIVKPMITEDLGAVYDNFKSYLDNYDTIRKTRETKNYFKPTLGTTEINGVTLTNNGDGTYTANGTANGGQALFYLGRVNKHFNTVKLTGVDDGYGAPDTYAVGYTSADNIYSSETYDSGGEIQHDMYVHEVYFFVREGVTVNNLLIKPMITDDVFATYDDFILAEYERSEWKILYKEALNSTQKVYKIDPYYDEILFECGAYNGEQVYGGFNVVIARNSNHPM